MGANKGVLRFASPNEQRTISREDLGFYHGVNIGAVYEFDGEFNVESPQSFFAPVQRCIEEHPFLAVVVADRHTNKAFYQHVPVINLEEHISVLEHAPAGDSGQWGLVEDVLRPNLDRPFSHTIPPWRVVVLPLPPTSQRSHLCFIAFSYSHTILDGPSGVAFHRTFLAATRSAARNPTPSPTPAIVEIAERALPPPFDTPQRLPISWSFLLGPLIGAFMPRFLANLLGLKPEASTVNQGTWTGTPAFFDHDTTRTRVALREIDAPLVGNALRASRAHGAKLTGTMHILMVRALSKAFADGDNRITNFASQTAINMRRAAGVAENEMGEFASGVYFPLPRVSAAVCEGPITEEEWAAARACTEAFADSASRLRDQPIGLLRYLPSIRKWMAAKVGQQRESSYEISNVGAFEDKGEAKGANILHMVFAQPGMVVGCPICINMVSTKGGSLLYTVTWPSGALGIRVDESVFIDAICNSLRADFERF
ncbi:alcohol acetyltransferase-domain-containing protein [Lasiosphaeria hispida]|uniref:Alcohol acetyltransferase-domain-containing protein n=1 Tax=Lasiosphaeria hispida TaxID=260671 RepID=A0AAJ0HVA4_9PEZI|nr:alcohol acetyltransferase-domain-containing protein [Lasiosphaeria hispida]